MRRTWVLVAVAVLLSPVVLAQDGSKTRRVQVQLQDEGCPKGEGSFCVRPGQIQVSEEQTLVLEVTNAGQVRHNLTTAPGTPSALADAVSMAPLEPDETATIRLAWDVLDTAREENEARNLTLVCGFEGHAALGEQLVLSVGPAEAERPQPGFGVWATLAALGVAGVAAYKRDR